MRLLNGFNEARIYLNPEPDEIEELAKEHWDTVRIMVYGGDILLASGYGHTHETIAKAVRAQKPELSRKFNGDSFILYHEDSVAYMNLEDQSGEEEAKYAEWSQYFEDEHIGILRDLIRESNLIIE